MAQHNLTHGVASGSPSVARATTPIAAAAELRVVLPFGLPALIGATASAATCYGSLVVSAVLGAPKLGINPHIQAGLMGAFALLAVYGLWQDRKRHHNNAPAVVGIVAVAMLILTLYVRYSGGVETLAYVLLVVAALLNQSIFLSVLNRESRQQAREIEQLNQRLELKVEGQTHEIDRLARLKQFLAPQVADLVVSETKDKLLETHRRYIACLFCDIRDFTAVSEELEAEEVIAILQEFHERIGSLVTQHRGTIGHRAGDGLMAFFNDPVPCEAPVLEAVKLSLGIRDDFEQIRAPWAKRGHRIGLGIGIASGYATLGLIGFQGRTDYTAIGGVVNIASRLCDRALDRQILLTRRAFLDVEPSVEAALLGTWELKGVKHGIEVHNLLALKEPAG